MEGAVRGMRVGRLEQHGERHKTFRERYLLVPLLFAFRHTE